MTWPPKKVWLGDCSGDRRRLLDSPACCQPRLPLLAGRRLADRAGLEITPVARRAVRLAFGLLLLAREQRVQPRKFRALALGLVSPFELGVGARQTIVDLRTERSQAARCFQLLGGVGRISEFEPRAAQQIVRGKEWGASFTACRAGPTAS